MDAKLRHQLSHAVTEYDRKQEARSAARKKGPAYYNPYALSHYLGAVQATETDIDAGTALRPALVAHFTGRLLDVVLKAVGEPKSTDAEQRF